MTWAGVGVTPTTFWLSFIGPCWMEKLSWVFGWGWGSQRGWVERIGAGIVAHVIGAAKRPVVPTPKLLALKSTSHKRDLHAKSKGERKPRGTHSLTDCWCMTRFNGGSDRFMNSSPALLSWRHKAPAAKKLFHSGSGLYGEKRKLFATSKGKQKHTDISKSQIHSWRADPLASFGIISG